MVGGVEIYGIGFTPLFCPYMVFGGVSYSQLDGNRNFARPTLWRCHNTRQLAVGLKPCWSQLVLRGLEFTVRMHPAEKALGLHGPMAAMLILDMSLDRGVFHPCPRVKKMSAENQLFNAWGSGGYRRASERTNKLR